MSPRTNSEKEASLLDREMRKDPTGYELRLTQPCPRCGAKPGERCKTKDDKITRWHVARLVAAIRAREAEVEAREREIRDKEKTWI